MTRAALESWVEAELRSSGLPDPAVVVAAARGRSSHPDLIATELVCMAREVTTRPDPAGWWAAVLPTAYGRLLLAGEPDELLCRLAEEHADPAPDCWDPNWPPHKVGRVMVPIGAEVGHRELVGDGMGSRAWVEVVEREGAPWAVIAEAQGMFADWWDDVSAEADRLLAEP
jgi:hypothetical protein